MFQATMIALIVLFKMALAQNIDECKLRFKGEGVFTHSQDPKRDLKIKIIQLNPEKACRMTVIPPKSRPVVFCVSNDGDIFKPNGDAQNNTRLERKGSNQLWLQVKTNEGTETRSGRYNISGNIAYAFQTPSRNQEKATFKERMGDSSCNTRKGQGGIREVRGVVRLTDQFKLCRKFNREMGNKEYITYTFDNEAQNIVTYGENYLQISLKINSNIKAEQENKIIIRCQIKEGDGTKYYIVSFKFRMKELDCVSKPYDPTDSFRYAVQDPLDLAYVHDASKLEQFCSSTTESTKIITKSSPETTTIVEAEHLLRAEDNITTQTSNFEEKTLQKSFEECNITFKTMVFTHSINKASRLRFKMTQVNPEKACRLTAILPTSERVMFDISKDNSELEKNAENYRILLRRIRKNQLWLDVYKKDIEIRDGKFNISGQIVYGFHTPNKDNKKRTPVTNLNCFAEDANGTVEVSGQFKICRDFNLDINEPLHIRHKNESLNISFEEGLIHFQYKYNKTNPRCVKFEICCDVKKGDGRKEYPIYIDEICPKKESEDSNTSTFIIVALVVIVAIILVIIWWQNKKNNQTKKKLKVYEEVPSLPEWTKDLTLSRGLIKLEEELGQGAFGVVYKGKAQNISHYAFGNHLVAVKTSILGGYQELLKEGEVLSKLEFHYNVINLLAISTDTAEEGHRLLLIYEYCSKGCLQKYLEENQENRNIEVKQMVAWTYQMSLGMKFLCDHQIIHGDLAARNILLDSDLNIKIGDFGKAHKINYTNIEVPVKGAQPFLWMAPEALTNRAVTLNSDKWSYGMTVWEIFSFGKEPYLERADLTSLLVDLQDGFRMEKPDKCPNRIYTEVILPCWNAVAEQRPEWSELISLLKLMVDGKYLKRYEILQKTRKKHYQDLRSLANT